MQKLYALTTFLKMAGGRMHTSHPIPLDPPMVISQWSATTGPRPGAGPCEVCYRSVCVFRINALSLKHFYNVRRNFGTFL